MRHMNNCACSTPDTIHWQSEESEQSVSQYEHAVSLVTSLASPAVWAKRMSHHISNIGVFLTKPLIKHGKGIGDCRCLVTNGRRQDRRAMSLPCGVEGFSSIIEMPSS